MSNLKKTPVNSNNCRLLDRKSSRGMIYENEELRLRTININAEVERGQSDIRKLRRENEQLRREIWSLRDEYDRLNKRFKANKYLHDSNSEHGQSESNSEDSDSCDTCRGDADINEECLEELHDCGGRQQRHSLSPFTARHLKYDNYSLEESSSRRESFSEQRNSSSAPPLVAAAQTTKLSSLDPNECKPVGNPRDILHVNFDHLSIVSEENLSNSDGNLIQMPIGELNHNEAQQKQAHPSFYYDENFIEIDGARLSPSQCLGAMSLPSLAPLRPVTPIEMVANQLNDLQSIVPPLSYFENIVQEHMGTTINCTTETNALTNTGDSLIQTNGWDYNIQSPFLQRKFQSSSHSSASSNSTSATFSLSQVNHPPSTHESSTHTDGSAYKNLKHFFSPIKPRLKLDTALCSNMVTEASSPLTSKSISPPVQCLERLHQNCDPPDLYVENALPSPYYLQSIPGLSLSSVLVPPYSAVKQSNNEPIYATAQKKTHSSEQSLAMATESSKNSVNLEQILNEIGTISEDILKLQLEKSKSQEKLSTDSLNLTTTTSFSAASTPSHTTTTHTQTFPSVCGPDSNLSKDPNYKNRKPYRSEMNLLLSYNGTNPVIIPLAKNNNKNQTGVGISSRSDGGKTDRDVNSPSPPQLPTPMAPFPTNLIYLGFDRLNQSLADSGEIVYPISKAIAPHKQFMLPASPTLEVVTPSPLPAQSPSPPPSPSHKSYSVAPVSVQTAGEDDRFLHESFMLRKLDQKDAGLNPVLAISSPDLSTTSMAAIAPIKRRIFSRQKDDGSIAAQTTRSFDGTDVNCINTNETAKHSNKQQQLPEMSLDDVVKGKLFLESSLNEINSYESSSGSEATKRKTSRRVSILCNEDKLGENSEEQLQPLKQELQQPTSTAVSVDKIDNMMPSIIISLKQHANSTPNSPHSNRRRVGINTNSVLSVNSGGSSTLHHNGHHHHHHHHHHHNRKLSQESVLAETRCISIANSIVNSSQDNVLAAAAIPSSPNHQTTRFKCSRRHSEGTVSSVAVGGGSGHPTSGAGVGSRLSSSTVGNGHHRNHHHHHHRHQDSNQETGTSLSERNSGSLASSRDSSTSLSMRSQRRKISVSSHTGGKIPWCGCWGNGCL
ncbi:uncharacterized protein LOC129953368 isoform X2 [Eupeodes corollae]|uniref:uncharacterized protein LOC129953368 isoform X2 n=1 Tax=Eupeodes corollae TaxID=290404 RepID=UPI002492D2FC|nr:uncharacterized protein LOC129953368 isoform X2 [Eupeodes corollae]